MCAAKQSGPAVVQTDLPYTAGPTDPHLVKMEWLSDIASLLPDEAMRQRFLLRIAAYGSQVDMDEPLWGMLDILGLTTLAYRALVDELKSSATEIRQLRGGVREALDMVESRLKQAISASTNDARELLEDVRAEMTDAVSPEQIAKSFTEEVQKQFAGVTQKLLDQQFPQTQRQLVAASDIVTKKLQGWVELNVNDAVKRSKEAMEAATMDFHVKLFGQWGSLIWASFGGGLIAAVGLFVAGYLVGKR